MIGSNYAAMPRSIYNPADPNSSSAVDPTGSGVTGEMIAAAKNPNLWDRLNAATGGAQGSGAFLRAAGALFDGGGLGGAIRAGTGYMDDQKAIASHAQQQGFTNNLALRDADLAQLRQQQANDLGWAGVANQASSIDETGRHNRAGEMIDANGQRIQLHGIDTQAATAQRGQTLDFTKGMAGIAQDDTASQRTHDASIYGTNVQYLADAGKTAAAGIGSKAGAIPYTETKVKTPASNSWFGPSTPASETTTHMPMAPVVAPATPAPAAAIAALKGNPNLRMQFEAKYGTGSAAQYLGGR
jgi:hypothetical protein